MLQGGLLLRLNLLVWVAQLYSCQQWVIHSNSFYQILFICHLNVNLFHLLYPYILPADLDPAATVYL